MSPLRSSAAMAGWVACALAPGGAAFAQGAPVSAPSAAAEVPAEPYATAVRLVERLFLEPKLVDEGAMLRAAARAAARDLHWLEVRTDGEAVELVHGSGAPIGRVEAGSMDDLPRALARLEALIVASGYDTRGVDVQLSVLGGMADALDRYSRVLADERLDRFNVRLTGTLVGIGASFDWSGDHLLVTSVIPGGPADLGGLRLGDEVTRIDGRSTVSMPMSEASRRVRGEEGTQVAITLRRDGKEQKVALTRAEVVVPNVVERELPGGVGYVYIDHVSQRTVENLKTALDALERQGALSKGLVIDLRGNTGGSMKESANVADVFLSEGLLLRTVGKDGGRVQNLQAEMYAAADHTEPPIPIVVVVDERTASGSEILAGALVELDRAALIGTRTYGKGTVQKIYNLEPDVRFKLTVARYILANDRSISDGGLVPDVVVGRVELRDDEVHYLGWDEAWQQVPWARILPEVHLGDDAPDVAVEVARRALLETTGTDRADIVVSVERQAEIARHEQQQRLHDAFVARGMDWSPSIDAPTSRPLSARVTVRSQRLAGDAWRLTATVANNEAAPLHQALVQLRSGARYWDDVVVPIGQVEAGRTSTGSITVTLPPGIEPRQDDVEVQLRADGRPALAAGTQVLDGGSDPIAPVRVSARLVPVLGEVGPHGAPVKRAELTVQNLSHDALGGIDVQFGFPGSDAVELLDHGARVTSLAPRSEQRVSLAMEVGPGAPAVLPLELLIEADGIGQLVDWPLALPLDGGAVPLEAPVIEATGLRPAAPAGPYVLPLVVTDDRAIDHVLVSVNGEKVAWSPGGLGRVALDAAFDLVEGENRIVVETEDDQRLTAFRAFSVRGHGALDAVDAGM